LQHQLRSVKDKQRSMSREGEEYYRKELHVRNSIKRPEANQDDDKLRLESKSVKEDVYQAPALDYHTSLRSKNSIHTQKSQLKNLESAFQKESKNQKPLFLKNQSVQTDQKEQEIFQSPIPTPFTSIQTMTYPLIFPRPIQYQFPAPQFIHAPVMNSMPFFPPIIPPLNYQILVNK
jgi:hypothetical protein